ncbi:hypothetical protein BDW02DRAFT_575806 [Decorospora gaudefroyi]|uniref:MATH and UCH domain-containing protein n=1 Tax=Decorospora gaudefroyi TaxID=184978 RepID=A0A6A5KS87_9PLEO|nr:hypothetical protein BDW02DRAFT_575806 [Decorospora gaudefroyi]
MSVSVFSQQPPPEPTFTSPPHSPNHLLHAQTPASPPPPPALPPSADTDMSAATNTLPPTGQNHDRGDAVMEDGEEPSNRDASTNTIAVHISAVEEDAMDVTPDTETDLLLPNSSAETQEATITSPTIPAPGDSAQTNPPIDPPPPGDPDSLPPPADPNAQPPPPPPPVEPVRSDTDSSDEDDGLPPWHELPEDMSSPDEDELKEIEATTEHSALDHEYWESKAFLPLEDPEYVAGESGRVDWTIDAYNGTREKPNHEVLMKSEVVTVGGHQWQIKFYPKGNDSDYLSVYLECLSVMEPKDEKDQETVEEVTVSNGDGKQDDAMNTAEDAPADETSEPLDQTKSPARERRESAVSAREHLPVLRESQHAPLPLLGSKSLPKRSSVAAQVSVVLYNPTEPRVNYSRTALHRFCSRSPDWGWTRFHGPYYEISRRMRGQRMPLLRNDKLAFTAYIRVVKDDTDCLWEHPNRENPWDSFAMTGLQGLMLGEDASAPGGNMISAIASWMLFKPFRKLLYSIEVADPDEQPFFRPKPLVTALQKVLYMLRTQVNPGAGAVALDDVLDALEWYAIRDGLAKLDVIELWEVLRLKLEEELQDMPQCATLQAIHGPKRDYSTGVPSYRVPVLGVETMQEAINKSSNFTVTGQALPELLTIEMERQDFDLKTRSYVKVLNKVTLDDRISISNTSYTLYGFVVHKQTLQSYVYQPILRPEGPGTHWYSFSDSKDENQVKCLTKRQALDAHEGKAGIEQVIGNDPVAYIAMYVRDDVAQSAFVSEAQSEEWRVADWIEMEVEKNKNSSLLPPMPPPPLEEPITKADSQDGPEVDAEPPKTLDFQIVDSRVFLEHEGPGMFDAFDAKWEHATPSLIHTVQLSSQDGCKEIREKLISVLNNIKDPRQVKFWFLDPSRGSYSRPNLLGTGQMEFSSGSYHQYTNKKEWTLIDSPFACRRIWVHVIDFDKLPDLPKEETTEAPEVAEELAAPSSAPEVHIVTENIEVDASIADGESNTSPQVESQSEDTPMSEPDEPTAAEIEQPEAHNPQAAIQAPVVIAENDDTDMVEVQSTPAADPPAVDAIIPSTPMPADTEMGGTQVNIMPPPPPPIDMPMEPPQPPPPARSLTPPPPPDEIYFFLKFWNPEKQTLEARGSHIAMKSARVDETVLSLLGLPVEDKKRMEMWEEDELSNTRSLKHRRTFAQVDLHNTSMIIVSLPPTVEQRNALAARAAFAEAQQYLTFRSFARNFPHKLNGHFTYNYFSSQYYKGEVTNGYRHGHGMRIYHSGATYNGTFRLGQRHGHGLYTFQNGDTYDGDWVDNQQHGTGTFVEAASGNTYVGGWQNDKKFGEGVTHWKNAQESERLCRICWDGDAEAAFYDCGHVVACLTCAREVQTCPVCRKRVLSSMKLYYVV